MRIAWFYLVLSVVLAHAFSWAQQHGNSSSNTLAYENGSITNNVYTNECFGISFAMPDGSQLSSAFVGLVGTGGKALHTNGNGLLLLALIERKEGVLDNQIDLSATNTCELSSHQGAQTVREFVSNCAHGIVNVDRENREMVKDAYSVDYGGKHFSRADFKQSLPNGMTMYGALVYTKFRGYFIGENLGARSLEDLEETANSLGNLSFREDELNSRCVMRGDDRPKYQGHH